jgi:hypothetical protein
MALRNGVPVILEEGRHILSSAEWKYVGQKVGGGGGVMRVMWG